MCPGLDPSLAHVADCSRMTGKREVIPREGLPTIRPGSLDVRCATSYVPLGTGVLVRKSRRFMVLASEYEER